MPRSSQWSLAFRPSNQNPVNTSPLPHACHMCSPPHPPWFNHPNNIQWRIQVMKLIIVSLCHYILKGSAAISDNTSATKLLRQYLW
jgi:hypothetical protein